MYCSGCFYLEIAFRVSLFQLHPELAPFKCHPHLLNTTSVTGLLVISVSSHNCIMLLLDTRILFSIAFLVYNYSGPPNYALFKYCTHFQKYRQALSIYMYVNFELHACSLNLLNFERRSHSLNHDLAYLGLNLLNFVTSPR